jgi:hypothetical protein
MKSIILLCTLALSVVNATSQNVKSNLQQLSQKIYPKGFDNHLFGILYYNGRKVYNLRGYKMCTCDSIDDLKISPAYNAFATLEHNRKGASHIRRTE